LRVYPFEIVNSTEWKDRTKENYLPRMFRMSRGSDRDKITNIIALIKEVNQETILSKGPKLGAYISKDIRVWWNIEDSKKLTIPLPHNKRIASERVLTRSGFTILGMSDDGPHRLDGPALTTENGAEYYYVNGQLHREDGPAIVFPGGEEVWYVKGSKLNEDQIELKKLNIMGFEDEDIEVLDLLDLL